MKTYQSKKQGYYLDMIKVEKEKKLDFHATR